MDYGYLTGNHAEGISPGDLARELEERGFASIWVPEHSHIPTERRSPYPNGGPLPDSYVHMMDPMVSLMAAASTTSTLRLCTGIVLLLEHDLLDLACTVATTDVLSGGRVVLGIGVGWNEEELENHRPDLPFKKRYSAMRERVEALRTAWSQEEASFSGTWDSFTESWVYPKPPGGSVPIALGNAGPLGMRHAAEYADEWCPIDVGVQNEQGKPDVVEGIARFRQMVTDAGRDPDTIPVKLFVWGRPRPDRLEMYAEAGVSEFVFTPANFDLPTADETLRHLDELAPVVGSI